jgi:hypothetical protein
MGWFRQILGLERDGPGGIVGPAPMAMSAGAAGFVVDNSGDLDNALRHGNVSKAGQPVNERTAL